MHGPYETPKPPAGDAARASWHLLRALEDPTGCRMALDSNLNGEYDRLIDIIAAMAEDEPLPDGAGAEAVAETMRWLPEEHARAVGDARILRGDGGEP